MNASITPAALCGNSVAESGRRPWRAVFLTPTLLAQFCAVAVLVAPVSLPAATNDESIKGLGLTRFVEPVFPVMLRTQGVPEGAVTLAIGRNAAGEPDDVLVLFASEPEFVPAALEAVRQWRFAAVAPGGQLAPRIVRIEFRVEGVVTMTSSEEHRLLFTSRVPVSVPRLDHDANKARLRNQPMPAYPASLQQRGVEGRAAVSFYVDQDGKVRLPEVIDASSPEFAQAALAAVTQWRYEPPQVGGRGVVATDRWEFKFAAN